MVTPTRCTVNSNRTLS